MPLGLSPQGVEGLQLRQDEAHELCDQQHSLIPAVKLQPKVSNPTKFDTPAPAKPKPNDHKPRELPDVLLDRYDHGDDGGREDQQHAPLLAAASQPKDPRRYPPCEYPVQYCV